MKVYLDGLIYSLQKGGGISRYTSELARGLAAAGTEVELFLHPGAHNPPGEQANLKLTRLATGLRPGSKLLKYLSYPLDRWFMERHFKKRNIKEGIFHSTYFTYYRNLSLPRVLSVHDLMPELLPQFFSRVTDKVFLKQKRAAINAADRLLCISATTARDLAAYYGVPQEKIAVTPLGVSAAFRPSSESDLNGFRRRHDLAKPFLLFVGQRGLYKNFSLLLEAFAQWAGNKEHDLLAVGGGAFPDGEREKIDELGLSDKVRILPSVSEEDLVLAYGAARAFVYPSLYEGFGLPILEALACGTPVIASDIPVFREVGQDALAYFDPKSAESLAAALGNMGVKDEKTVAAGRTLAARFIWTETARKTLVSYGALLNIK